MFKHLSNLIHFLPRMARPQYAITPYDPCGAELGTFVPESECLEEGSRIVGGFLVKKGFNLEQLQVDDVVDGTYATTAAMIADQANQETGDVYLVTENWTVYTKLATDDGDIDDYTAANANMSIARAIDEDNLRVVTGLTGNWAPGTSNKKPGMGFQREKHSSTTYTIPLKHYSVDSNLLFWNTVNGSNNWSFAFVFEDYGIWAALDRQKNPIPMDIVMQPASEEELGGTRRFEGSCGWTSRDLPYTVLAPVVAAFTKAKLAELFA